MRIAYVCADQGVPVFGRKGCSIHVQEVVRALTQQGEQVELFTPSSEGDPPPGLETIPVHSLPRVTEKDAAARERKALAVNDALWSVLEHEGPFDLVYERYSLWSLAGMDWALAAGVPGLLEVNAPLIEEQAEHRILVDRRAAELVARRVFQTSAALIAVSDEVADYLREYAGTHDRIHVVPNGVNPDRFSPRFRSRESHDAETFTVGFVGSLKPWHGLTILIEAFALLHQRYPEARLLIVGEGPEQQRLVEDLSRCGLSAVAHLTGAVPPSEVPRFLACMDAAVAPYPRLSRFYFSPLKVYEYMAAGLPVVASRLGQLEGLIQDGINGLLCAAGDAVALAASLGVLREDPALRRRLGEAARTSVLRHHTWEVVVSRILRLAQTVPVSGLVAGGREAP
jgi:glycosyltransferase involved in cell wall biosynthesis